MTRTLTDRASAYRSGTAAPTASPVPALAEIIVVTPDDELVATLGAAMAGVPVRVASSPADLADLLLAGRAGALVLDAGALEAAAVSVARRLAEQFPDMALVAVGARDDEARLAALISTGQIYRFLHRPLSAARARTFIAAALRRPAPPPPGTRAAAADAVRQAPLLLLAAIALVALGVGLAVALRPSAGARRASGHAAAAHVVREASRGAPAALAAPMPAAAAASPATAPPALPTTAPASPSPPVAEVPPPAAGSAAAARGATEPAPAAAAPVTTRAVSTTEQAASATSAEPAAGPGRADETRADAAVEGATRPAADADALSAAGGEPSAPPTADTAAELPVTPAPTSPP